MRVALAGQRSADGNGAFSYAPPSVSEVGESHAGEAQGCEQLRSPGASSAAQSSVTARATSAPPIFFGWGSGVDGN